MYYQEIFYRKFYEMIILLIVGIFGVVFFWVNKSYWNQFEFLKNNRIARIGYKIFLVVLVSSFAIMDVMPLIKDKMFIDSNNYVVCSGIASQKVVDGGLLGLSKSIMVVVDGVNYEFGVVGKYDDIKKGDSVKVTYLPNSKYAVIERCE